MNKIYNKYHCPLKSSLPEAIHDSPRDPSQKKPLHVYVKYVQVYLGTITITIIIIIVHISCFSLSCYIYLLLDNISCMIKKHYMCEPIEIFRSHSLENGLKSTQPCIKLLTCLSIECTFLVCRSIRCCCCYNQIWSRPTCESWITPGATKSVCFAMILIMIAVNYKSGCL